jgi:predicted RNA binding protein YcfA (HicA-like mRNA interferase family)
MSRFEKILNQVLSGSNDDNIRFSDLCNLLERMEFSNRIKGSHHIYFKAGIKEIIVLQPLKNKAKAYQVKQVRLLLLKYKMF